MLKNKKFSQKYFSKELLVTDIELGKKILVGVCPNAFDLVTAFACVVDLIIKNLPLGYLNVEQD